MNPIYERNIADLPFGDNVEAPEFADVISVSRPALETQPPDAIFLDLELGTGDAISKPRSLFSEKRDTAGIVQLMSGEEKRLS